MSKYPLIMRAAANTPWAMDLDKMEQVAAFLQLKADGLDVPEDKRAEITAARHAASKPRVARGVAIIPVLGVISYRVNMLDEISGGGGTSVQQLTNEFREAVNNPDVGTIVLQIDSPGGAVSGIPELADEILAARDTKKIIAVADTMSASAAYWLMSAATEVVITPSGEVGSIGVYAMHLDESVALEAAGLKPTFISAGKFKTEGNSTEPLSEDAHAAIQADVDAFYTMFTKAVAKGRGVSVSEVRNGFGQARMVLAKDAKAMGMVDRVDTFSNVLARLGVDVGTGGDKRAEVEAPELMVEDAEEFRLMQARLKGAPYSVGLSSKDGAPVTFVGVDLASKDDAIAYAQVGGPPNDWFGLEIIDLDSGEKVENVIEVNAEEGWLIRHKTNDTGRPFVEGEGVATEKIEGRFKIQRPEASQPEPDLAEPAHNPRHRRLALLRHA